MVVASLEHADGTASCALTGDGSWKLYNGFGDKAEQQRRTRQRVAEVVRVRQLLEDLNRGGWAAEETAPAGQGAGGKGGVSQATGRRAVQLR